MSLDVPNAMSNVHYDGMKEDLQVRAHEFQKAHRNDDKEHRNPE